MPPTGSTSKIEIRNERCVWVLNSYDCILNMSEQVPAGASCFPGVLMLSRLVNSVCPRLRRALMSLMLIPLCKFVDKVVVHVQSRAARISLFLPLALTHCLLMCWSIACSLCARSRTPSTGPDPGPVLNQTHGRSLEQTPS